MNMKLIFGVIGLVLSLTVGFIFMPTMLSAIYTVTTNAHITDYSGLADFSKIVPLLALLAMVIGSGVLTFQGVRQARGGGKRKARSYR